MRALYWLLLAIPLTVGCNNQESTSSGVRDRKVRAGPGKDISKHTQPLTKAQVESSKKRNNGSATCDDLCKRYGKDRESFGSTKRLVSCQIQLDVDPTDLPPEAPEGLSIGSLTCAGKQPKGETGGCGSL